MAITYHKPGGDKKSSGPSVGGFIHNLSGDARDLLVGIVESPYYIGKAAVHDIGAGNFHDTGQMLGAIGKSYSNYYGPLFSGMHWTRPADNPMGDLKKFGSNFYKHPGQPILDVATLFTGGGAAVAKGSAIIAKGAEEASLVARVASKAGGLKHIDAAAYDKLAPFERTKAIPLKKGDGALVAGKHSIINSAGGKGAEIELARNPVIRARQLVKEHALGKFAGRDQSALGKFTNGFFGNDRRSVRISGATTKRVARRESQQQVLAALTALNKLPKAAQTALFYRIPGFRGAERYDALLSHRMNEVANSARGPKEKLHIKEDIKRLSDPKVREQIINPSADVLAVEQHLLNASDAVQTHRALRGAPGDPVERAKQPLATILGDKHAAQIADSGERLGIVSYSQHRLPRALRGSKLGGVKMGGTLGSDMASTGHAFKHALYDADPKKVLHSMMDELHLKRTAHNLEYALAISRPYTPAENLAQAQGVANGTLKAFTVASKPIKQLHEVANWASENILPLAKDAAPDEAAAFEQQVALLKSWDEAARQAGADGLVMPMDSWNDLAAQAEGANGLYNKLLKTPTRLWRDLTLSLKGSFYVNNFLGNILLGLVAHPIAFLPAVARHGFAKTSKLGQRIDEVAPDIARSGQASTLASLSHSELPRNASKLNPANLLSMTADKVAHAGGLFTESNFRRAAMSIEINKTARLLRKSTPGMKHGEAVDTLLNDPHAVDAMAAKVYHDLLDYSKLTPFETNYIRPLLPFWNFTRSIAGRTITLALDEPWKMEVLKALSETALRENNKGVFANIQGELPPYLQGLMKVGPTKNGVTPVYSTYAANPFSAVSDTIDQVSSLVAGSAADTQSPLAQFNPYIRSAIEASTGRDLFFDKPLQGSRGHIFASQLAGNFPQVATYTRARFPGTSPYVTRSLKQSALQYAGIPLADFNEANANKNIATAAYYDNLDKSQQRKYLIKRAARDRGRYLGLTG